MKNTILKKLLLSTMVASVSVFGLSACSKGGEENKTGSEGNKTGGTTTSVDTNKGPKVSFTEIRIGTLNSKTGANKDSGGMDGQIGQEVAIKMINAKGGVLGKYKIVPVSADDQSNPDIGAKEAERLIKEEKVAIVAGVFASGIAVKVADVCETNKAIFWDHIAVGDAVLKDKNRKYVFRPQILGSNWGKTAVNFINENVKMFGVESAKDLKVVILHEDSPYGTSCADGDEDRVKKYKMQLLAREKYTRTAKDLDFKAQIDSIMKLKPDIIFHTAYKVDLELFLKQAKEKGLKVKALVGQGAGHSYLPEIGKTLGNDVTDYIFNSEGPFLQVITPDKLTEEANKAREEALKIAKADYNMANPSTYFAAAFSNNWVLFEKLLPIVVEKYGEVTADNIAKACADLNIPEKGTPVGYGVKFAPPGDPLAGQNTEAYPHISQWYDSKWNIVYPVSFKAKDPVIPLPKTSAFAEK